jgi:sugar phosphate isomerase/epimerase
MKIGVHTWSFRDVFKNNPAFTVFDCLDAAADMGFAGIEIMTGKANMPPDHIGGETHEHLEKVVAHAQRRGISITCLATYNDFAYVQDEAWRRANIDYIQRWLTLAGRIGVPNIRMLTGYYNDHAPRERLEELTRDGIRACVPFAEAAGVNMAIENHNSIFFSAAEIVGLIEESGSPRLTACPDPSNWGGRVFFDGDAAARATVLRELEILAPYATQAHLKICGINPDGSLPGFDADLDRVISIYRQAGYDGMIVFESMGKGDLLAPLARARQTVEDAIRRCAG